MKVPPTATNGSIVRSFMATKGRTATTEELPIETVVEISAKARGKLSSTQFEQRQILELLESPASIAEISAELKLPIRTTIILVSELASSGMVDRSEVVESIDKEFLMTVRNAIETL